MLSAVTPRAVEASWRNPVNLLCVVFHHFIFTILIPFIIFDYFSVNNLSSHIYWCLIQSTLFCIYISLQIHFCYTNILWLCQSFVKHFDWHLISFKSAITNKVWLIG